MPKLSVIVPIYNAQETLRKCVDSILAQTYTDLEVVLVDDGSTDNSLAICNEYAERDSRVVVYHKENAGLVAARKSGLQQASGEYIGFVDSDDFVDADMYEVLMSAAQRDGSDIAIGGIILDYPTESKVAYNALPEGFYDAERMKAEVYPQFLAHSGFVRFGIIPGVVVKVFRKAVLERALPMVSDAVKMGEDSAITSFAIYNAASISVVKHTAYHYIQGDNSMIRSFNPNRLQNICTLYDCISTIDDADYQAQLNVYIAYVLYGVLAECVQRSGYDKKTLRKALRDILSCDMARRVLKRASGAKMGAKDKLKLFLMKHNMIRLLQFVLR